MRVTILLLSVVVAAAGCAHPRQGSEPEARPLARPPAWPKDWSTQVGRVVTLEGTAANAKLGAQLRWDERDIWIDGLERWPEELDADAHSDQGRRVRVTGTVIRRDDLPVFVAKPGNPVRSGIPVSSAEELERAKWRFLLKDAKWSVLP